MKIFRPMPLLILFLISGVLTAEAQIQVLQKMINKIAACKSISYNALSKSNSLFSGATYTDISHISYAAQNDKTKPALYNITLTSKDNSNISYTTRDIYNGKDLLNISLTDKTYRLKKNYNEPTYNEVSVYDLVRNLKDCLKNKQFTITQLKDSTVNQRACYYIRIRTVDSVAEKTNSYTHHDLLIGEKSYLPVYYKTSQQGVAEKGGMVIGTIKTYSIVYFTQYKLNTVLPSAFTLRIPVGITTAATFRKRYAGTQLEPYHHRWKNDVNGCSKR
jgi:hypothetical protein